MAMQVDAKIFDDNIAWTPNKVADQALDVFLKNYSFKKFCKYCLPPDIDRLTEFSHELI